MSAEVSKTQSVNEGALTVVTVIYHKNCTDGWCSAYQLKKFYPDANLIAVNYGEKVPEIPAGTNKLIIADFSFKKDILLDLKSKVPDLIVLDHHKTAKEDLEGLDFCTFDMNESGASLVSKYLKGLDAKYVEPWFVSYVKDRDLWTWNLPESRAVSAFISTFEKTMEAWDALSKKSVSDATSCGKAIIAYQKQLIESILKSAVSVKYEGHDILVVNSSCLSSEIGEEMYENRGAVFGVIYYVACDGKVNVSLRAKDFDVSTEARRYGGGGHRLAAGCQFNSIEDFNREFIR